MALKIIDHGTPEYAQMIKLRDDILRKPLGLSFSPEELEKEKDNILIAFHFVSDFFIEAEGVEAGVHFYAAVSAIAGEVLGEVHQCSSYAFSLEII